MADLLRYGRPDRTGAYTGCGTLVNPVLTARSPRLAGQPTGRPRRRDLRGLRWRPRRRSRAQEPL